MDAESFQRQALAVDLPDETFDPTFVPTTGEEYLKKVIHERMHCPAVVVKSAEVRAKLGPTSGLQMLPSDYIVDSSDESLRPTPEWKQYQLEAFTELREKIINLRLKLSEQGYTSMIPLTDDEEQWKTFCQENEPFLSTVMRIDQRSLEALLEFESNWLQERREEETKVELANKDKLLGTWIYSTLACLHLPLEPNVHSALRDIAKSCVIFRNKLNKDQEEDASALNMFIFLIAKYFNQLDLAEYV